MFKKNYYRDERSIQRNSFWHRAYSQSFEKCRRYKVSEWDTMEEYDNVER